MPAARPRPLIHRGRSLVSIAALASVGLALSCGLLKRNQGPPAAVLGKAPGADFLGSAGCYDCHDTVVDALDGTLHSVVPLESKPGSRMCETCHGPVGNHVESYDPADIFGVEDWAGLSNGDRSAACLSCHETMSPTWSRSAHSGEEVSCWNCHEDAFHIEGALVGLEAEPVDPGDPADGGRFCFQCHAEIEQEFLLQVTHPVTGSTMGCGSCHGPHGEEGTVESAADVSEVCTKCHLEVKGPWIYEHDAMFEGCTSCHMPHGSPNQKLLVQTGNGLCLQCHIDVTFPRIDGMDHSFFIGSGAGCTQCHFEVHGSNASETLAPGH